MDKNGDTLFFASNGLDKQDHLNRDGRIDISIPVKKVRFREEGNAIVADYKITVYVYRDNRKIDALNFNKRFSYAREGLPADKALAFSLPYPLLEKGKYYLDIIMEDVLSGSRSRNFTTFKR